MHKNLILPHKDFQRVRQALLCEQPDRVPLMEHEVDVETKERFLGKSVRDMKSNAEFWARAGYDYVYMRANYEYNVWGEEILPFKLYAGELQERGEVNLDGIIKDETEFETYPWPNPETIDYSTIKQTAINLWDGMKVIAGIGGIFTRVWRILGFDNFCLYLIDKPHFIKKMFRRIGDIQAEVLRNIVQMESIGAIWYGDDLAFKNGSIVAPSIYRKYLFPHLEEMARTCRENNLPFIIHSDGNLHELLDDLYACGFKAIHPIEPDVMDIMEIKNKWKGKLSLIGNVDAHIMTTETPKQVEEKVKQLIREVGPGGGYCVASSGGVPSFTPIENYKALIHAVFKYGKYPLRF